MRRAIRLGIFIGTVLGMSACATHYDANGRSVSAAYGAVEVGRAG
ncbi:hypothetical protein [Brevundimonas sp. SORGH_AS_0993]|nr:hypothetical protein [Brevundimonas sp. SORGH_AS_0993]MDQ1153939.1 hypothetical protein [Brevundimonas sp. SORGH_AS_0993]